jgi:hypothetical protein
MEIKKQLDQLSKKFVYKSDNNQSNLIVDNNNNNNNNTKNDNQKATRLRPPKPAGVSQSVII